MRIRSIKPEFYRSSDITVLNWETRLLFIALWSYVDDNGVGIDKLSSIVADLFADDLEQDPEGTFARVSRGLQQLAAKGRIVRYECDNKKYLYVTNWPKHQKIDRPNKARYPLPDDENPVNTRENDENATPSREYREGPSSGTEEQRSSGTEEQRKKTCPATQDEFIDWYLEYPRKESKGVAEKAYAKARKMATAEDLVNGAIRYRDDPNREAQFTKMPATWLNGKCWEDGPLPEKTPQGGMRPTGSQVRLQAGLELMQRAQAKQDRQSHIFEIEG